MGQLYSVKAGTVNGADSTRAGESPQEGEGQHHMNLPRWGGLEWMPGFKGLGQTLCRMVEKLRWSLHRANHTLGIGRWA